MSNNNKSLVMHVQILFQIEQNITTIKIGHGFSERNIIIVQINF